MARSELEQYAGMLSRKFVNKFGEVFRWQRGGSQPNPVVPFGVLPNRDC